MKKKAGFTLEEGYQEYVKDVKNIGITTPWSKEKYKKYMEQDYEFEPGKNEFGVETP